MLILAKMLSAFYSLMIFRRKEKQIKVKKGEGLVVSTSTFAFFASEVLCALCDFAVNIRKKRGFKNEIRNVYDAFPQGTFV